MKREITKNHKLVGTDGGGGEFLRIPDVARTFDCSKPHIYNLMASGELPWVRIGGCRRIRRRDLEQFIRRNLVNPRTEEAEG